MSLRVDPLNLIICGVGGQGNILISRMIGRILAGMDYYITIGETFGAAQRGGAVHSSMRISKKRQYGPLIPRGRGHVVASMEPLETLRMLELYGNENVLTVSNTRPIHPVGVLAGRLKYPALPRLKKSIAGLSKSAWLVDVTGMALDLGSPIAANMILLGALVGINKLPLAAEQVEEEIGTSFPASAVNLNLKALRMGREAVLTSASRPQLWASRFSS